MKLREPRPYRMRRRAELVDQTRQRIIEATAHLHGTVGPGATTVAAIAERAGVTRLTVYRHFPDEAALFAACSAHWQSQQRLPQPQQWGAVADPVERLRAGLADLYRFYREGEPMLTRIYHDQAVLPEALRRSLDERDARFRAVLLAPFPRRRRRLLRAAVGHAVQFSTWRSLGIDEGLSDAQAVEVMTALVAGVNLGP